MDISLPVPGEKPRHFPITIVAIVTLFLFLLGGTYAWAYQYHDRIGPNVFVSDVEISGLHRDQAVTLLQEQIDLILTNGLSVTTNQSDLPLHLPLTSSTGTDVTENVHFDLDQLLDRVMRLSHEDHPISDTYRILANTFTRYDEVLPVQLNKERIKQEIYRLYPEAETRSSNPTFTFMNTDATWIGGIVPGNDGTEFAFEPFLDALQAELGELNTSPLQINLVSRVPSLSTEQARLQLVEATHIITSTPLDLAHTDEATKEIHQWQMSQRDVADLLEPGTEHVEINTEHLNSFLDTLATDIEQPAQNAKIEIENGRVKSFLQSKKGIRLDRDAILKQLQTELLDGVAQTTPVEIATIGEEAVVQTGDVNDLGITEVLGFGTSSYKGSPKNRRGNIQNGVTLLNGTLIAPGETFSLIQALQPFTLENGYLPELVIKGEKIIPEIAGGLCQIGTTTFRAVMNSGLQIDERHNHSLVVSYYNDPANGNPGTDATIYEPTPDFKFTNNTGHYVLFQAENIVEKQQLKFTLWGTTDGRKGSYSPPVVLRWIPAGEKKITETTDLEPGKEQCQAKHNGADTTFDYTVVNKDGIEEVTTFTSHYRPLPELCLVGVEKLPEPVEEPTEVTTETPTEPVIPTTSLNN